MSKQKVEHTVWVSQHTLEVVLSHSKLRLSFLEEGLVRCRYVTSPVFENIPSYGVAPEYRAAPPPLQAQDCGDYLLVRTPRISLRIRKEDSGLEFYDAEGVCLCADAEGFGHRLNERTGDDLVWVQKKMPPKAHFFGLGDKPGKLNLRGRRLEMWGADHYKFTPQSDPLYKSIPFFLCLNEGRQYGIFFDNTMRSYFDFGKERADQLLFGADGGVMDYYFIMGSTALETVSLYTRLTGLPPMPPLWTLGYHQSKWSYYPEQVVTDLAAEFRKRRIPCDSIHLDIHHMKRYQALTWDRTHFPDPPGMIRRLDEQGFKVVCIVDPGIKINPNNYVWKSGFEKNLFCRRHDGALLRGTVWPGECNFPDFTSEDTRQWWASLFHRQVAEYGVRGIWTDMNEPVMFPDKTFPDDTRHAFDGFSCSHLKAHNVYGQCMAKATRQGMEQAAPQRRPFVLSRSGFAGLQRWAATWTGDNDSDWENLQMANLMIQRLSASGVSFCGADTGGFLGHPTPELFCRWMQMAAFHLFFRNHNNGEFGGQEPWCFGEETETLVRRAIEERYRLLPYLYTQFHRYHTDGTPVIRSLALMLHGNTDMYWRSTEFFLGDALYVVPVHYKGQAEQKLFVPPGTWYCYHTDNRVPVSNAEFVTPVVRTRIPVLVKGGCIIPRWPVQQYVGELAVPPCTLDLWWAANTDETSSLYEDAGDGPDAERFGAYRLHTFRYRAEARSMRLTAEHSGNLDNGRTEFAFALHGLPRDAAPHAVCDGTELACEYDAEAHMLRATLPVHFATLEISF